MEASRGGHTVLTRWTKATTGKLRLRHLSLMKRHAKSRTQQAEEKVNPSPKNFETHWTRTRC